MMLNVVVFPAPLGPITPTISHSPARSVTSLAACTPPKRIEQPRASSTDIAHPLSASGDRGVVGVLQAEAAAPQRALERPDLLTHAAGMAGQGEPQRHRSDDDRGVLLGQRLEPPDLEAVLEELVEQVTDQRKESRADHDTGPV